MLATQQASVLVSGVVETFSQLIDRIVVYYSDARFGGVLSDAKEKYFQMTGPIDCDGELYEHKMRSFTEWFVLNYRLKPGLKVFEDYHHQCPIDSAQLMSLNTHVFSLFDPLGSGLFNQKNRFLDCLGNEKLVLASDHPTLFVVKGELFTGRLIQWQGQYYFLPGFCTFPLEVRSPLLKQAKKIRKKTVDMTEEEFLLNIEGMRYKSLVYQHVPIEKIFHF